MYHVCSCVVGWVVVVVCVELGSRAGLFEPAVYEFAFHGIPFRFRSVEPGHVAREVVLPSLGWSSFVCGIFFLLGSYGWVPVGEDFAQRFSWCCCAGVLFPSSTVAEALLCNCAVCWSSRCPSAAVSLPWFCVALRTIDSATM